MDIQQSSGLAAQLREAAGADPGPIGTCSGRGIVICAGGTRLFTCAWLLIAMLRRTFSCRLPVEVWHIGDAEIGPAMRALLEAFDVRVIDALNVARVVPVGTLGGWQLKTYALLHSDFQEILLLDADNMPVKDPSFLFENERYLETGALFWPDIVRLKAANPIWAISGLSADTGASFETGQILIDKRRHWRALTLAHWINQNHRAFEDMLYGDKDACYVAWRMVGTPYHLIGHAPKLLEHTFVQRSPDGEALFQHRHGAKWLLNGPNPRIEGFRFETECFMLLADLRRSWDGTIFNPPPRSPAARAMERELIAQRHFHLAWVGSHEHVVSLRPGHMIEGGCGDLERCWFVADGADGMELRIVAHGVLSCALRRDAQGVWRGDAGDLSVRMSPEPRDFAQGLQPAATPSSAALLATADRLLECAAPRPAADDDLVVTLATLASLDAKLAEHLENRAAGQSADAALARAALARHRATARAPVAVRPGAGWQANLATSTEALPKR